MTVMVIVMVRDSDVGGGSVVHMAVMVVVVHDSDVDGGGGGI